jgi:hypothetical protein
MELPMKLFKSLILLSLSASLFGCSILDHRDYREQMEYGAFDQPMFEANKDFMIVSGDRGRDYRSRKEQENRTPASVRDSSEYRYKASLTRERNFLENQMAEEEYQDYLGLRDSLGNTSQQIFYLRLSERERRSYLRTRGIKQNPSRNLQNYQARNNNSAPRQQVRKNLLNQGLTAFDHGRSNTRNKDITMGMVKDDVVRNWGRPERMDVAGDPRHQNERWAYRKNGNIKYIYFEKGRVEGWNEAQ